MKYDENNIDHSTKIIGLMLEYQLIKTILAPAYDKGWRWNYVTVDKNGSCHLWTHKPVCKNGIWDRTTLRHKKVRFYPLWGSSYKILINKFSHNMIYQLGDKKL